MKDEGAWPLLRIGVEPLNDCRESRLSEGGEGEEEEEEEKVGAEALSTSGKR